MGFSWEKCRLWKLYVRLGLGERPARGMVMATVIGVILAIAIALRSSRGC